MKLLQKDPADRHANAAELANALAGPAGVVRDHMVPAFSPPSVETHVAPLPFDEDRTIRDRSYALPIIAVLIVLLIGGAVAVGFATQHDAPAPPRPALVAPPVPMARMAGSAPRSLSKNTQRAPRRSTPPIMRVTRRTDLPEPVLPVNPPPPAFPWLAQSAPISAAQIFAGPYGENAPQPPVPDVPLMGAAQILGGGG